MSCVLQSVALGFVDEIVVEGTDLVAAAVEYAQSWVAEGKGRGIVEQGLIDLLDQTNQREGQQLADAMFSPAFWQANGVPAWVAKPVAPLLKRLAKL